MEITQITPKLVVVDADAAIDFYTTAFGASLDARYTADGVVVFAQLSIGGASVQLKEQDDVDLAPPTRGGITTVLDVVTGEPDQVADRAVSAGADVVFPVADQPYGARQGRIRDPFGHEWILGSPLELSPEEVQRRLEG